MGGLRRDVWNFGVEERSGFMRGMGVWGGGEGGGWMDGERWARENRC